MQTIILAITGSIAASKGILLYHELSKNYNVRLVVTYAGLKFLHKVPNETLTQIFSQNFYDKSDEVDHIKICEGADLFVSYPASLNFMSSCAYGLTTEIASLVYLACHASKIHFPAMNTTMYESLPHRRSIEVLKSYGDHVVEANKGVLACGTYGIGRAKEVEEVVAIINNHFKQSSILAGKKVLLNFGRTRAYIDGVRYITNNASGKMGVALYNALKKMGAEVIAIAGDTDVDSSFAEYAPTNQIMLEKVSKYIDTVDIFIACAALNDFKIKEIMDGKIDKKNLQGKLNLELELAIDVLETMGKIKKINQLFVGFSVQKDNDIEYAKNKLQRKNLDAIIINKISAMGSNENELTYLTSNYSKEYKGSKADSAHFIVEEISKNYST